MSQSVPRLWDHTVYKFPLLNYFGKHCLNAIEHRMCASVFSGSSVWNIFRPDNAHNMHKNVWRFLYIISCFVHWNKIENFDDVLLGWVTIWVGCWTPAFRVTFLSRDTTLLWIQSTQRLNPKEHHQNGHCLENLKSENWNLSANFLMLYLWKYF